MTAADSPWIPGSSKESVVPNSVAPAVAPSGPSKYSRLLPTEAFKSVEKSQYPVTLIWFLASTLKLKAYSWGTVSPLAFNERKTSYTAWLAKFKFKDCVKVMMPFSLTITGSTFSPFIFITMEERSVFPDWSPKNISIGSPGLFPEEPGIGLTLTI